MTPDEQRRFDALRARLDATERENRELRAELARLRSRMDSLVDLAAVQNERLSDITDMLRGREDQVRRGRSPAPPQVPPEDDEPDDDGGGGGAGASARAGRGSAEGGGASGEKKPRKPRTGGGRKGPEGHLAVDSERHAPCTCEHCGSEDLLARDTVVVEKSDVVPSYVRRRRIVRETTVCAHCGARTTAPMPPMPCDRSLVTCRFLAWLVVQKFVLLVPLDRIRRHLRSQGIRLPMSTLVRLVELAADLLAPVDGVHWKLLKYGSYLQTDGTGLKVLIPGQRKAWDGYFEAFMRDELVVHLFGLTKHGDELAKRLTGFRGTILCDAESRFDALFGERRFEANCNAHARRKFRDAEASQPKLAAEGGAFLTEMYAVAANARRRGLTGSELLALRRERTRPIVDRFRAWLVRVESALVPSDPPYKAVRYDLNHFDGLTRFVDHAEVAIDNNRRERRFQNHAKLRLGCLFAGSPEGGRRWAIIAGVVATAQNHELDVSAYLEWAFERLGTHSKVFGLSAAEITPAAYEQGLQEREADAGMVA